MNSKKAVTTVELMQLLVELRDKSKNTCFRYRILGEMWKQNFFRIVGVSQGGVALLDDVTNKLVFIQDLSKIVQFEIDASFQAYQAHFHYEVLPYTENITSPFT